ncbi:MAG: hypothetical protein JXR44_07635 [Thiotrichales bacterium]|nr:hypothetical protein [Thiotrichales bacterium]
MRLNLKPTVPSVLLSTVLLSSLLLSACSTRQEGANFRGSTEQRLVTYSINGMAKQLDAQMLAPLAGQRVRLYTHFVIDNEVVRYAHQRLRFELSEKFALNVVGAGEPADYRMDLFFTSLGTDRDATGLSVPIVNLSDPEQSAVVNILAVDMYHGVAEGYFYLTNLQSGEVSKQGKLHSRVRSDRFSTPFFSFPVSSIDESLLDKLKDSETNAAE